MSRIQKERDRLLATTARTVGLVAPALTLMLCVTVATYIPSDMAQAQALLDWTVTVCVEVVSTLQSPVV